ncbi:MAG: hypothetical protein QM613_05330 [Micrococcaceae bacterium]
MKRVVYMLIGAATAAATSKAVEENAKQGGADGVLGIAQVLFKKIRATKANTANPNSSSSGITGVIKKAVSRNEDPYSY